jgi:hypothetical protein
MGALPFNSVIENYSMFLLKVRRWMSEESKRKPLYAIYIEVL